tara:strand:+ start:5582 stop:6598 length:1017 start_codon:yes stop_codon:yes gene_type:complete
MGKVALITGIGGQDGAYLAKNLLEKGFEVVGTSRRSSADNLFRLKSLGIENQVKVLSADIQEHSRMQELVMKIQPNQFYNLAAQSFVADSFKSPIYTSLVNGTSVLNILESIRLFSPETKFYQASTSEMFGKVYEVPQNESTRFYPRSPYGVAKLYAHHITINYRESYDLFACSGILFNHESPLRGGDFVTKKIVSGLVEYSNNHEKVLELGNLEAQRDWGFAGDYVEAMRLMLEQKKPDDFVICTGKSQSIRNFCEIVAKILGIDISWEGNGLTEIGIDTSNSKTCIRVNEEYYRPAEVDLLLGDATKAEKALNWSSSIDLNGLAQMMVDFELNKSK